jgi:hypothetical protein
MRIIFHLINLNKGKAIIGTYFGKEILSYTPLLKCYLQQGLKITKFYCAIEYTTETSFQQFADKYQMLEELGILIKHMN